MSPTAPPRRAPDGLPGRHQRGFSLVELVLVCAVLSILAAVAFPSIRYTRIRGKEIELRAALRELRGAIDEHKRWSDASLIEIQLGTDGYPEELETLVEPIDVIGQIDKEIRFLRRIPVDPMTGLAEWGIRSYQDEPDSSSWGGENVYDVYSLASGRGLDGTPYSAW
jgi:general secretion pathway protein G